MAQARIWTSCFVTPVLTGAPGDPGLLALASEGVLRLLVERGDVVFDSFEYVVLMHYLTELQRALIAERERIDLLDRIVGKVSALISLALWAAPAGRVVKLVTGAFTVSVLSFYTYSVLHRLAVLDRQLGSRLAELDRRKAAEIVALGLMAAWLFLIAPRVRRAHPHGGDSGDLAVPPPLPVIRGTDDGGGRPDCD